MTISRRKLLGYGAGAAGLFAMPYVARAQAAPIRLVFSHHIPTTHLAHRTAEMFAADATVPPQFVGLGFSLLGMVLGSFVPTAAPQVHSHGGRH